MQKNKKNLNSHGSFNNYNKSFLILILIIIIIAIWLAALIVKNKSAVRPNEIKTDNIRSNKSAQLPIFVEQTQYYKYLTEAMNKKDSSFCFKIKNQTEMNTCSLIMDMYIIPGTNQTCNPDCMNRRWMNRSVNSPTPNKSFCLSISNETTRKSCEDWVARKLNESSR